MGDSQQVTVHGILLDTQEPCRWPQESIFDATPEPLPKVDKGSLGRVYEALGGVLMSSTFLSFLLTISVGVV